MEYELYVRTAGTAGGIDASKKISGKVLETLLTEQNLPVMKNGNVDKAECEAFFSGTDPLRDLFFRRYGLEVYGYSDSETQIPTATENDLIEMSLRNKVELERLIGTSSTTPDGGQKETTAPDITDATDKTGHTDSDKPIIHAVADEAAFQKNPLFVITGIIPELTPLLREEEQIRQKLEASKGNQQEIDNRPLSGMTE